MTYAEIKMFIKCTQGEEIETQNFIGWRWQKFRWEHKSSAWRSRLQCVLADDFYAAENYIYKDFNGENSIDLYIFDIMLGKENGFCCAAKYGKKEYANNILSALDDEEHVIEGLNFGADDYIAKPFRKRELLARVSANIRRKLREQDKKIIKSGELSFVTAEERLF